MRRSLFVLSLIAGWLVAGPTPAWATPGNGAGQATFVMVCDGAPATLTVGGGSWSAAYLHEANARFIPYSTSFSISDEATGHVLHEEHDVKHANGNGPTSVCVEEFVVDGLRFEFVVRGKIR
jgi:hypothetical protein